jgi:hypothetical protein
MDQRFRKLSGRAGLRPAPTVVAGIEGKHYPDRQAWVKASGFGAAGGCFSPARRVKMAS